MQLRTAFITLATILLLTAQSNTTQAQMLTISNNIRPPEGWPAEQEEMYQPIVKDSTLLFAAPWLVWQCTCSSVSYIEFYNEVDFSCVRTCWGRKEVFDRVAVNGHYSFVQRGVGQLYATLEADAGGFLYTEISPDSAETDKPLRTVHLVFDTESVVRTDTAAIYKLNTEDLITRLTRYVELTRADRP